MWLALNQDREIQIDDTAQMALQDGLAALDDMILGVENLIELPHADKIINRINLLSDADKSAIANRQTAEDGGPDSVLADLENDAGAVFDAGIIVASLRQASSDEAIAGELHTDVNSTMRQTDGATDIAPSAVVSDAIDDLADGNTGPVDHSDVFDSIATDVDWVAIVTGKEDDLDPDMFAIFHAEAEERFGGIDACLSGLAVNVSDKNLTATLKRAVHTLKGSANTAGARKVGALFHYLEDLMDAVSTLTSPVVSNIQSGVDAGYAAIKAVKDGESVIAAVARLTYQRTVAADQTGCDTGTTCALSLLASGLSEAVPLLALHDQSPQNSAAGSLVAPALAAPGVPVIALSAVASAPQAPQATPALMPEPEFAAVSERARAPDDLRIIQTNNAKASDRKEGREEEDERDNVLRVPARVLDNMVKSVGEINITRNRVGLDIGQCKTLLANLSASIEHLSGHLRQIDIEAEKQMQPGHSTSLPASQCNNVEMDRFTRLQELSHRMAVTHNDVLTQQAMTIASMRDMEDAVAVQGVLLNTLTNDLNHMRQVKIASVIPLLKRVVRQVCRDTNKKCDLIVDADIDIDRGILHKITNSLEHILRNAVTHGIESPEDRANANKPEIGVIHFRTYHDGSEVVVEVCDDGVGIDHARVLERAIKRGFAKAETKMNVAQIGELLFEPGFSTTDVVSENAGRGVGLDVVRSDISAMGGRVQLTSQIGAGTSFVLRVPATLTMISGAAVTANGHLYVIPVAFIDKLMRVGIKDLELAYDREKLMVMEDSTGDMVEYEFWGMWEIVGQRVKKILPAARHSILLMRGERVAVHVDDVCPAAEFVFRPLGPQTSPNSGLIGSTISAAGNASLVVDPARVSRHLRNKRNDGTIVEQRLAKRTPLVLIVDDSLTVRSMTARLLKKNSFRFTMAENGQHAIDLISVERPDVILMDIEMPVMNGYEATQAIRATPEWQDIPVIMITSRVGDAHRQKAFECGVNDYVGKPYNDQVLLDLIQGHCHAVKNEHGQWSR
jgi:chemosensory pili system protein ChpA (sensor histidine kinase/response regulator)